MLKAIENYPMYLIDESGNIFSKFCNRFLKQSLGNNGYYSVELFNDNGSKRISVHRLVAKTFIPNPDNLPIVNHKDENKLNNNTENLEWCSGQYNLTYGTISQRRIKNTDYTKPSYRENAIINGKKVSKPVNQYDKLGNFIATYESGKEASRQTGINHSHIIECCKHIRYKSVGGYKWEFVKEE